MNRSLSNLSFESMYDRSPKISKQAVYIKTHFHQTKQELLSEYESSQPSEVKKTAPASQSGVSLLNKLVYSNTKKQQRLISLQQQVSDLEFQSKYAPRRPALAKEIAAYKKQTEAEAQTSKRLKHIIDREQRKIVSVIQIFLEDQVKTMKFKSEDLTQKTVKAQSSQFLAQNEATRSRNKLAKFKHQHTKLKKSHSAAIAGLRHQRKTIDDDINVRITNFLAHDFICKTKKEYLPPQAPKNPSISTPLSTVEDSDFPLLCRSLDVPLEDLDEAVSLVIEKWKTLHSQRKSLELRFTTLNELVSFIQQVNSKVIYSCLLKEKEELSKSETKVNSQVFTSLGGEDARKLETFIISSEASLINMLFKACSTLKLIKKVGSISKNLKEFYNQSARLYKSLSKNITKKSSLNNFAKRTWAFALTNLMMQKKLDKDYMDDKYMEQASKLMGKINHDIYQYIPISRQDILESFLSHFPNQNLLAEKLADLCASSLLVSHILNQPELEDCVSCDKNADIGKISFRIIQEASEKSKCLTLSMIETNKELYKAMADEFLRIKNVIIEGYSKLKNGNGHIETLENNLKQPDSFPKYISKYRERMIARTAFTGGHERFQLLKSAKTKPNSVSMSWAENCKQIKVLGKENSEVRTRQTSQAVTSSRGSTRSKISHRHIDYPFLPNIKISFL